MSPDQLAETEIARTAARKSHQPTKMRSFRRMTIPKHAHPFVRRLYEEMNFQKANPRDVEERAGLGRLTINQWRTCRSPDIHCLEAALNVMGLGLEVRRVGGG